MQVKSSITNQPYRAAMIIMVTVLISDGFCNNFEKVLSLSILLISKSLLQNIVDRTDVEAFEDSSLCLFRTFITDKSVIDGDGWSFEVIFS